MFGRVPERSLHGVQPCCRLEPRCHGTVIGSWKLRESVAYGDGMGVSTDAARDASSARGHLSSGE